MNRALNILGWLCALAIPALGQVTNVGTAEANQIRLEWPAMPGNPYRVFASDDLVEPAWSNLTPDGVVFSDEQGFHVLPMGERKGFIFAVASDYMIVDLSEGSNATSYPVSYTNNVPEGGWGDEYKTTKLVLRRIPAGTFIMGSPSNELGHLNNELQHAVTITKDYYIGVFETTQKQVERIMGFWHGYFTNEYFRDSRPVEYVGYVDIRGAVTGTNWPATNSVDADSFMGQLRMKTGMAFDLPTEAQWEYACRAATTSAINSGHNPTNAEADSQMDMVGRYKYNRIDDYDRNGDTSIGTARVGSYLPNAWGLFDMHGNVREWCLDWFDTYPAMAEDPLGADTGLARMVHGGSWNDSVGNCRSAFRLFMLPDRRDVFYGFRVALQPSGH